MREPLPTFGDIAAWCDATDDPGGAARRALLWAREASRASTRGRTVAWSERAGFAACLTERYRSAAGRTPNAAMANLQDAWLEADTDPDTVVTQALGLTLGHLVYWGAARGMSDEAAYRGAVVYVRKALDAEVRDHALDAWLTNLAPALEA